jgi:hypothetical protein
MSSDESTGYWDELATSWQQARVEQAEAAPSGASAPQLERRLRRQSRCMAAGVLVEALVTAATLLFAFRMVSRPGAGAFEWISAGGFVVLLVVAVGHSAINRRGLWRAAADTPNAYLDLLRRRADARQRALRFAIWLLAAETAGFCVWLPFALADATLARQVFGYGFLACWSAGAAVVILVLRRRARRDAVALEALFDELE